MIAIHNMNSVSQDDKLSQDETQAEDCEGKKYEMGEMLGNYFHSSMRFIVHLVYLV